MALAAALTLAGCHSGSMSTSTSVGSAPAPQPGAPNTLTRAEERAGWKLLFDGKTTNGWRGYQMTTMPPEWMVMDGVLMKMKGTEDIVTVGTYANFELSIDWKVGLRGNAGIFYRGTEKETRVYWSAPEYQIAEDSLTPDSKNLMTSAGAVYQFYPSRRGVNHPAGQWNTAKIVAKGPHIEHWLNGVMLAQYEMWSPEFTEKFQASKFKGYAGFARATSGVIAIQGDHQGELSLRNIKIRELK
jgi:hypothetical protein